MKFLSYFTVFSLLLILNILTSCSDNIGKDSKTMKVEKSKFNKDSLFVNESWTSFVLGDIDNDGKNDTAFLYTPPIIMDNDSMPINCAEGKCYNKIKFSCHLPEIFHENSTCGIVENVGRLSNGKVNEILFTCFALQGSWGLLILYQFIDNNWYIITKANVLNNDENSYKDRIIKNDKGYFIIGDNPEGGKNKIKIKFKNCG